jgi:hypothetical protein
MAATDASTALAMDCEACSMTGVAEGAVATEPKGSRLNN